MRKLYLVVALFSSLALANVAEAKPIHAGKALHKVAAAVSAPVRHPVATGKASFSFSYTTIFAAVEGAGVVLETVGTGVQKVGGYIYSVGEVLAGGKNQPAPAPAPSKP